MGFRHRKLVVILIASGLISAAWAVRALGGTETAFRVLMTLAALVAGLPVVRLAWSALLARQFSIPLLVSVAAAGAIAIGEVWEAAAVTLLYVLGSYLEELTLARTRAALRSLVEMAPRTALVMRNGEPLAVPAADVQPGELVIIRPGDRVPVDGKVTAGRAVLDTAALTGEPLPAEVGPGDQVLSGSVSQGGYLEVSAERAGADTTFSRLIYLVAEAQEQKPKVQRFLDRFARWYTPAVIAAAVVLYVATRDLHLALTFLVIGCPGALVVAAPVAVVAGLGNAARHGVLIKGGERLERIARVDVAAFDKTGTVTRGRPRVSVVIPFGSHTESEVLALAAAAEQRSEHHLATAILAHAREMGAPATAAFDWSLEPGLGAVARTESGEVLVGNRRLLTARGIHLAPGQEDLAAEREARGETLALVAAGGLPVGLIGITDPVRPEAAAMVTRLRQSGVKRTVMLTGDNRAAAELVARQLGIDEVRAGLSPAEKVAAIDELRAGGHVVAMIGDGINDAPALAAADVSIAMGGTGTEAAIETADITLMSDRLERIPYAIALSRRINAVVRQNVGFAVAIVLFLLIGVVGRLVFLSGGMFIHEASVLLVIANGMRLLSNRGEGSHSHQKKGGNEIAYSTR